MPQDKSPMEELNDSIRRRYVEVIDDMKKSWNSPGYVEDLGMQIAYAEFTHAMEGKPLKEWPENFEGYVHLIYIFYDCKIDDNIRLLQKMENMHYLTWKDCWWSSDRFGRHEFRVLIKPSEYEWKVYYGEVIADDIDEVEECECLICKGGKKKHD